MHAPVAHCGYPVPVPVLYEEMVRKEVTRLESVGILEEAPKDTINIGAGFLVLKGDGESCRI